MHPGDRNRILRGLGLGAVSLLLLSGAVFASQSGTRTAGDTQAAPSGSLHESESPEPSGSPEVKPFSRGVIAEDSSSPEASPENEPGDDNGQDQDQDEDASPSASPSASASADEDNDDHGSADDNSGPGGGEDENEGPDDNSGPGGGDDSGHHEGSDD